MKKKFAFFAGAVLLGTSAYAADQGLLTTGIGSLGVGYRDCSNTDSSAGQCGGHTAWSGDLKGSMPIANSFSLQADVHHERYVGADSLSAGYQVDNATTYGLHASYRDPSTFLAGIFAGYSATDTGGKSGRGPIGGIEGQYYFGPFTFYGQVGRSWEKIVNEGADTKFVGNFLRVAVRYFLSDDTMFQAGYARGNSDTFEDAGDPGHVKEWTLEGKTRIMDKQPLYGFAQYRYGRYQANGEDTGSEKLLTVGVSYEFGSPSLKATDRRGATLDTPTLPTRAIGWAQALD